MHMIAGSGNECGIKSEAGKRSEEVPDLSAMVRVLFSECQKADVHRGCAVITQLRSLRDRISGFLQELAQTPMSPQDQLSTCRLAPEDH